MATAYSVLAWPVLVVAYHDNRGRGREYQDGVTVAPDKLDLSIQFGDVDGDGKQDVTVVTHDKRLTIYDVKQAALRIVEIIAAVLAALGINAAV